MIKLSQNKVKELHNLVAEKTGGDANVRDEALLNSAISSAYQTFAGVELYKTIEEKGANLGYLLISNHAFVDGNKRIGMLVMLVFLEINGVKLRLKQGEVARVGLAIASGSMSQSELLSWILENK